MNLKQLAKMVGRSVRVWPIPIVPGEHRLDRNSWHVLKPLAGRRYYRLQLAGSVAVFELIPDLMSNFRYPDWIMLEMQITIIGVKLEFAPLPRGQAEQTLREHERASTLHRLEQWNNTWAVWIQPRTVAGGMPNGVPGSDGL